MADDEKEQRKALTITELIDADEGLKSKRKLLTITSLILLALTFSGAKVEEANTFILKLKFDNQNGIAILLVLAIVFLLIRYYNYAKPYHEKLFREWSDRMLKESYFHQSCHHSETVTGLVHDLAPKKAIADQIDPWTWYKFHYESEIFKCGIRYSWTDQHESHNEFVNVGWKNYLKVMGYEVKYRILRYFNHRENLDILAPYALGVVAISSYVFHAQLQALLIFLSVK